MIHRLPAYAAIAALAIGLVGCATTERPVRVNYNASQNETTYRANSIRIPIEVRGSGYGSQFNQLRMSLFAECSGRDCQPSMATMTLATGGSSELYMGDRTLVINADDEQFEWPDPRGNRESQPEQVVGMVAQMSVSVDQLKAMATADALSGTIGSVVLDFGSRSQQRIRDYLVRMGVDFPSAQA
jgi:hypothetical protein